MTVICEQASHINRYFLCFPKVFNFKEERKITSGKQRIWKSEAFNLDEKTIFGPYRRLHGLTYQGQSRQVIMFS